MVKKGTPRGDDLFTEVFRKEVPQGVEVRRKAQGSTSITFWARVAVALVASPGDWFLVRLYRKDVHKDTWKLAAGTASRIIASDGKGKGIVGLGLYCNSLMCFDAKVMSDPLNGDLRVYARYSHHNIAA
jgi:hypothetical protein|tara:strand:+ start:89 stop:475 length:387 start_codon:yes stop_codon:yes gene_type:complete